MKQGTLNEIVEYILSTTDISKKSFDYKNSFAVNKSRFKLGILSENKKKQIAKNNRYILIKESIYKKNG